MNIGHLIFGAIATTMTGLAVWTAIQISRIGPSAFPAPVRRRLIVYVLVMLAFAHWILGHFILVAFLGGTATTGKVAGLQHYLGTGGNYTPVSATLFTCVRIWEWAAGVLAFGSFLILATMTVGRGKGGARFALIKGEDDLPPQERFALSDRVSERGMDAIAPSTRLGAVERVVLGGQSILGLLMGYAWCKIGAMLVRLWMHFVLANVGFITGSSDQILAAVVFGFFVVAAMCAGLFLLFISAGGMASALVGRPLLNRRRSSA